MATSRLRHHEEFGVLVLFVIPRDAESVVEPHQGTTIYQCRFWGCGKLQASLTGPLFGLQFRVVGVVHRLESFPLRGLFRVCILCNYMDLSVHWETLEIIN